MQEHTLIEFSGALELSRLSFISVYFSFQGGFFVCFLCDVDLLGTASKEEECVARSSMFLSEQPSVIHL